MPLRKEIERLNDVNVITYLTDLFSIYKTEKLVDAHFLNGLLEDVVRDVQKATNYPAVLLIEPIEDNYSYNPTNTRYQSTPVSMLAVMPINWCDWSTNEIHTNALGNLKSIVFGFQQYLLNDSSISNNDLNFRSKSYTHYSLAAQKGNQKKTIFDKVSAVEFNFNLVFTNKFKTCQ